MVVPIVDVVDRPPCDLPDFVRLRPDLSADRVAEVQHRDDAMRAAVRSGLPCEDADELADSSDETDLFGNLAHDRARGRLVRVDPTGNESPAVVVDPAHEQDPVPIVEQRGVGADLRGHIAEVGGETGAHLDDVETGSIGVFARRQRQELLVTVAIERIGGVMKARLRDRAHLVEESDDVDGPTLVAGIPARDNRCELLAAAVVDEPTAAVDREMWLSDATPHLARQCPPAIAPAQPTAKNVMAHVSHT